MIFKNSAPYGFLRIGGIGNSDCRSVGNKGFSMVELTIALATFSIIVGAIYYAYVSQVKDTAREYRLAESEMEFDIIKSIIGRDIFMAGYGLADDYSAVTGFTTPRPAAATNGSSAPDTLTLMGTALGTKSRASQGWSYITSITGGVPSFATWNDSRESLQTNATVTKNDAVIIMEPHTRKLLAQGGAWLFRYNGTNADITTPVTASPGTSYGAPTVGTLAYGLQRADEPLATQPYYAVVYSLDAGSSNPKTCESGTRSLLRAESSTSAAPTGGDRVMACVLDFQVAFGLDSDDNGTVNQWDNGGGTAAGYTVDTLKKRLKQIRVDLLVQEGNRDPLYTYPSETIRVGEGTSIGRDVILSSEQRKYRWRLVTINVTPGNVR